MKDILLNIVRKIVDRPDVVKITEHQESARTVFEISVSDEDKGKVIGKQGQTIKALRHIFSNLARKKEDKKINIEVSG